MSQYIWIKMIHKNKIWFLPNFPANFSNCFIKAYKVFIEKLIILQKFNIIFCLKV